MKLKYSLLLLTSLVAFNNRQLHAISSAQMQESSQQISDFLDTDPQSWTPAQVSTISGLIDKLEAAKVQRSQIPQWRKRLLQQGSLALNAIDLNQKLAEEKKKVQEAQARAAKLKETLSATKKQLATAKTDVAQFESDLTKKSQELKSIQSTYKELENAAAKNKAALEDSQKKFAQQQAEQSSVNAKLMQYEQALSKQKAEADDYEKQMTTYTNVLSRQKEKLAKDMANLNTIISAQQKELEEAQLTGEMLSAAQNEKEALTKDFEALSAKSSETDAQIADLQKQLTDSKKAQDDTAKQLAAVAKQKDDENKKIAAELKDLKEKAVSLAAQLQAAPQKEQVAAQLKTLEDQISGLTKAKTELESDKAKLQKQITKTEVVLGGPDSNLNPQAQAAALLAKADSLKPEAFVEAALKIYNALPKNMQDDANIKGYKIAAQYDDAITGQFSAAKSMLKNIQAEQKAAPTDEKHSGEHKVDQATQAAPLAPAEQKVASQDNLESIDAITKAALKKAEALDFAQFNNATWQDFIKTVDQVADAVKKAKKQVEKLSAQETLKRFGPGTAMGNLIAAIDDKVLKLLGNVNAQTRANIAKVFDAVVPAWPNALNKILADLGFPDEVIEDATGNFEKYKTKALAQTAKLPKKLDRAQAEKYIDYVIEKQKSAPKKLSDTATDADMAAYTKEVSEYVVDIKILINMIEVLKNNKEIKASLASLKEPVTGANARDNKFTIDLLLVKSRQVLQQIEDDEKSSATE